MDECEVYYWRDRGREVDFVLRAGSVLTALEVKSGRNPARRVPRETGRTLDASLNPGGHPAVSCGRWRFGAGGTRFGSALSWRMPRRGAHSRRDERSRQAR
ncbi:MAG: DUF4143 domain-containing protein [Gemmatimonadales bacterium]|nr:DUF4143 domain-containing protein [Gemmatimonadales bacterium]MYG48888.1 DUF4143 domain-containing protein [Gemmatimonadales bacterium]MYK02874.1 DUF4143 domain-containing protein [Candidatus Palauibacter ramosifaciens]